MRGMCAVTTNQAANLESSMKTDPKYSWAGSDREELVKMMTNLKEIAEKDQSFNQQVVNDVIYPDFRKSCLKTMAKD
eukprot:2597623-Pyramimonas_sp.AAC.1